MMFFTLLTLAIALVLGSVDVSQANLRRCPRETNAMSNFNFDEYNGAWYRYGGMPFQAPFKCALELIVIRANGTGDIVIGYQATIDEFKPIVDFTVQSDEGNSPTMTLGFSYPGVFIPIYRASVLNTDYNNWAIVETCNEPLAYFRRRHVWVLTREKHPDGNITQAIGDQLQNLNYDPQDLNLIDQDC